MTAPRHGVEKGWYEFKNTGDKETTLFLYGEIGGFGNSAASFVQDLQTIPKDNRLVLRIHSPGGVVTEGNAIFTALRSHPGGCTTHIDGLAASMASVVALAGDVVQMAGNGLFMIHNVSAGMNGDADDLRKMADTMDKIQATIVNVYKAKTGLSNKKICQMMDDETWMTATEAHELGFVDEVTGDLAMAAKFDLSRFGKIPETAALWKLTSGKPGMPKLSPDPEMEIETVVDPDADPENDSKTKRTPKPNDPGEATKKKNDDDDDDDKPMKKKAKRSKNDDDDDDDEGKKKSKRGKNDDDDEDDDDDDKKKSRKKSKAFLADEVFAQAMEIASLEQKLAKTIKALAEEKSNAKNADRRAREIAARNGVNLPKDPTVLDDGGNGKPGVLSRSDFRALRPSQRMAFIKNGGTLIDE